MQKILNKFYKMKLTRLKVNMKPVIKIFKKIKNKFTSKKLAQPIFLKYWHLTQKEKINYKRIWFKKMNKHKVKVSLKIKILIKNSKTKSKISSSNWKGKK